MIDDFVSSVGVLVPAGNRIFERDLRREISPSIAYHINRIPFRRATVDELQGLLDDAVVAAPDLAATNVDLLAFACTSGSLIGGSGYDKVVSSKISSAAGGVATTTTTTEVLASLRDLNAKKLSVFTPYVDSVNEKLGLFLEQEGFAVQELHGLGLAEADEICSVEPHEIASWVDVERLKECDAIFISCTAFRGVEAEKIIRNPLTPIVTSNGATIAGIERRLQSTRSGK